MTKLQKLTVDQWSETFKPKVNHLDDNASFDDGEGGIMFETYGPELEYVRSVVLEDERLVWTYMDGDNGPLITNGYHLVNRIGYFIGTIPWTEDVYEVSVD